MQGCSQVFAVALSALRTDPGHHDLKLLFSLNDS